MAYFIKKGGVVKQRLTCCKATLLFIIGFIIVTWLGIELLCYTTLLRRFPCGESSTASYIVYILTCFFTVASLFVTLHLIVARTKLSCLMPLSILIFVFAVLSVVYYWVRRFELAQLDSIDDTVLICGWGLFLFRFCFVTSIAEVHMFYTFDWERDWRDTSFFLGYRLLRNQDIDRFP